MIVKCTDRNCCKEFRTNWLSIFPDRFIPAPCIYRFGPLGLEPDEPSEYLRNVQNKKYNFASLKDRLIVKASPKEADEYSHPPFDLFCPSMQPKLLKCICKICGQYWPSEAAKKRHFKACHGKDRSVTLEEYQIYIENHENENKSELCTCQSEIEEESTKIQVIKDFEKHLISPFEIDDNNLE